MSETLIMYFLKYINLFFLSFGKVSFLSRLNNNISYKGRCKVKVRFSKSSKNNNFEIEEKVKGSIRIKVSGNNNSVKVGTGCNLNNLNLRIVGNNNTVLLGKSCSFGNNCSINMTDLTKESTEGKSLIIGDNCMISYDVDMRNSDGHPIYSSDCKNIIINHNGNIKIANNVWIGSRVTILKNSIIEENTIVGACSLVRGIVDANSVYGGVPVRKVKSNVIWKRSHE